MRPCWAFSTRIPEQNAPKETLYCIVIFFLHPEYESLEGKEYVLLVFISLELSIVIITQSVSGENLLNILKFLD